MGLSQSGDMLIMPDSPLIMTDWASSRVRADEGDAVCLAVFYLGAYPLGACASLSEAPACEDEPRCPSRRPGGSWDGRACSGQAYFQPSLLAFIQAALNCLHYAGALGKRYGLSDAW